MFLYKKADNQNIVIIFKSFQNLCRGTTPAKLPPDSTEKWPRDIDVRVSKQRCLNQTKKPLDIRPRIRRADQLTWTDQGITRGPQISVLRTTRREIIIVS